jgi:hypothetical protein
MTLQKTKEFAGASCDQCALGVFKALHSFFVVVLGQETLKRLLEDMRALPLRGGWIDRLQQKLFNEFSDILNDGSKTK